MDSDLFLRDLIDLLQNLFLAALSEEAKADHIDLNNITGILSCFLIAGYFLFLRVNAHRERRENHRRCQ